jgi:tetratricopeptide (TPR) repeat protein
VALSAADEAARLARETGQSRWAVAADLAKATAAGERGDLATARALADRAEAELLPIGAQAMLALVQFARGRYAVAHSQYMDGFEQLGRILDPDDIANHPFVGAWALPDIIEAAARGGRLDAAEPYLDQLSSLATQTSASYLRAAISYVGPLLAPDDEADRLYRTALRTDLFNWPCFRGRMLLNYGRWLRRQRRVADARPTLRAARESFDALGFGGLAELARQELRASGEPSIRRTPDARGSPDPARIPDRPDGGRGNVQPRNRPAAVHLAPDGRLSPLPNLPQARDHLAQPAPLGDAQPAAVGGALARPSSLASESRCVPVSRAGRPRCRAPRLRPGRAG